MKRKFRSLRKQMRLYSPFNVRDLIFPCLMASCCDVMTSLPHTVDQQAGYSQFSMEKSGFKISELWEIVTTKRRPNYNYNINFNENISLEIILNFCLGYFLCFKVSTLICSNFSLITAYISCLLISECGNDVTIQGIQVREY